MNLDVMFWIAAAVIVLLAVAIGMRRWSIAKGTFKLSYLISLVWLLVPAAIIYWALAHAKAHIPPPAPLLVAPESFDPWHYLAGVDASFEAAAQAYESVDTVAVRYNPARDGRLICTGMLTLGKASDVLVEKDKRAEGIYRQGGFVYASKVTQGDYPLTIAGSDLATDFQLTPDYEGLCWSISSAATVQTDDDVMAKSQRMYKLGQRQCYGIEGQHNQVMIGWHGNNPPDRNYFFEFGHYKAIPHEQGDKRGEPSLHWKLASWPPGQPLQLPGIPTSWRGQRIYPIVHVVFVPKDKRPFTQPFETLVVVNGQDVRFHTPVLTIDAREYDIANDDLAIGIIPLVADVEIHVVVVPPRIVL